MNVVVSQALALGLPVIATRHSGLPEQVIDGVDGYLVDEGDYVALAERILLLAEGPDLVVTFGAAGRKHVEGRYDVASLLDAQLVTYRELSMTGSTQP